MVGGGAWQATAGAPPICVLVHAFNVPPLAPAFIVALRMPPFALGQGFLSVVLLLVFVGVGKLRAAGPLRRSGCGGAGAAGAGQSRAGLLRCAALAQ